MFVQGLTYKVIDMSQAQKNLHLFTGLFAYKESHCNTA
jgi:hypothetical protein